MNRDAHLTIVCWSICLATAIAGLADEPIRIVYREQVTNFFGEQEVFLHIDIVAAEVFSGRVRCQLVTATRTLAVREEALELAAGKTHTLELRHKLPPVRDGIVFPLELQVDVDVEKADKPTAELNEPLYLLAANPLLDRQEWLKSLAIKLFDPAESTAKAITSLEVPYDSLTNLETLADLKSGVVIVGEGVAWDDYGDLGASLLAAARRGVSVICLAPASGELQLPFAATKDDEPAARISLRRREVLRELDKRFSLAWSTKTELEARELEFSAMGEIIVAKAAEPGRGWPWVEVQYGKPQARFIWCGLGLIRSWEESPTPRYVLTRLLETVSPEQLSAKAQNE